MYTQGKRIGSPQIFASGRISPTANAAPAVCVLWESDGWLLQYHFGGVVVRPWIRRVDYATLAFIPRILARNVLRRRTKALIDHCKSKSVRSFNIRIERLEGVEVEFAEDDIMTYRAAFTRRSYFMKSTNILDLTHFLFEHQRSAIENICSNLCGPSALFLALHTEPAIHNVSTLVELSDSRAFSVLDRVGDGPEFEDLALGGRLYDSGG